MENIDIRKIIEEENFPTGKRLTVFLDKNPEIRTLIEESTSFLDGVVSKIPASLRIYCILNNITIVPICPACGVGHLQKGKAKKEGEHYIGFSDVCSKKCTYSDYVKQKKEETNLLKYGVRHPGQIPEGREKAKKTCVERFGVEHATQSKDIQNKQKETNMARYGAAYAMQSDELKKSHQDAMKASYGVSSPFQSGVIRERAKETLIGKYGVDNAMKSDEIKAKVTTTCLDRYGHETYHSSDIAKSVLFGFKKETIEILNDKDLLDSLYKEYPYEVVADILDVSPETVRRKLVEYGIENTNWKSTSFGERSLLEWVSGILEGVEVKNNVRGVIGDYELDIYIPSKNIAIEYNGLYWHSEVKKDKKYHQEKSLRCKENGILLIHVWEDDWIDENKKEIVKKKIQSKLQLSSDRVYARKCSVEVVEHSDVAGFLEDSHIQGKTNASTWICLRDGSEIVAVVGLKIVEEGVYDLVRYATSKTVVGGLGKSLAYFKKNFEWKEIFTYAHLDYSHGDLYEKTGFDLSHVTVPGMWYVKGNKRYRREKFMKHKLKEVLSGFNPDLTESENMRNHGFVRLYDAGSIKYVMKNAN